MNKVGLVWTVLILRSVLAAEWKISLDYTVGDDWSNARPLGEIVLSRGYDGNVTGSFRPQRESNLYTDLKAAKPDSLYRIRASPSLQTGLVLYSSAQACRLLDSRLVQQFWVALDSDRDVVISVTVFPDRLFFLSEESDCGKKAEETGQLRQSAQPEGGVIVINKGELPIPDTAGYVAKMEKERRARQHGAEADNRSFLAKYWMYIVPVVLFLMISSAMNPEAQGGGEGGQ